MLYRKRFYLRELPNSPVAECGRRNKKHVKQDVGKGRRLSASASRKASDIAREFMKIWKSRKAGICLEDIL